MIFQRATTPWSIEVVEDEKNDGTLYFEVFRTTPRDNGNCEQLTLIGKKTGRDIYIQIRIFKGDDVTFESLVPACARVSQEQKRITVTFLQPLEPA